MTESAPRVSVVVSTYQRADRLPRLVAALEAQTLAPGEFEVVIVNDGSTDGTATVLSDLAARAPFAMRPINNPTNRGPASGRNIGWRAARAPVIAFTDDDCAPEPRWLEAGLAAIAEGAHIVQGQTIPDPSSPPTEWPATQHITAFNDRYETCNIFYRRATLEEVGGFDETLYFFGEDSVAGWAARRRGAVGRFAEGAVVRHAVTERRLGALLRWALLYRNWNALVRRFPEMRREILWLRLFLRPRTAAFDAAIAGVVAGVFWWPAFLAALPYVWFRRPRGIGRRELKGTGVGVLFDGAVFLGLVTGSIRERTVVL